MQPPSLVVRYGLAVVAVTLASVVRALLDPLLGDYQPFAFSTSPSRWLPRSVVSARLS